MPSRSLVRVTRDMTFHSLVRVTLDSSIDMSSLDTTCPGSPNLILDGIQGQLILPKVDQI